MDFFLRDGDETRLKNAQLADEMDLLYSRHHIGPWGPELVACAQRDGAHVCWNCLEMFEDHGKRRSVEVRHGHVLLLLHAGCVGKKPRSFRTFDDLVRGHQLRRAATQIVKGSASLEVAHEETSAHPLSLDSELFASARKALGEIAPTPAATLSEEDVSESVAEEPLIQLAGGLDSLESRETGDDN